jgi:hypothetical protein
MQAYGEFYEFRLLDFGQAGGAVGGGGAGGEWLGGFGGGKIFIFSLLFGAESLILSVVGSVRALRLSVLPLLGLTPYPGPSLSMFIKLCV